MEKLVCNNCGGELVRGTSISNNKGKTAYIVRCLRCNSEFDQYCSEYYREFIDNFTFDKDSSVFEVGLNGMLKHIEYEIVGRVRYQDEGSYEKSTWDEWIVKNSSGKFSYIIEENDRIYLYKDYIFGSINVSKTELNNLSIEFEGKPVKKIVPYTGRVVIKEGEIPFIVDIGDGVEFYDFKRAGEDYTLKRCDDTDKILVGEKLLLSKAIEGFRIEKFRGICNSMIKKWRSLQLESRIYAAGMIISLILSIYNCFGDIPVKGVMDSKNVLSENLAIGEDDADRVYESQILYGPFDVPAKDKLYNAAIKIDENRLFEAELLTFRLMFIEENRLMDTQPGKSDAASLKDTFDRIDAFMKPVESYMISGYIYSDDNRGYRPVYRFSRESDFIVDESGKYYFYLEFFSNCIVDIDSISLSMSRTESNRYYAIIAFIFFILWGACNKRSIYYQEFTKSMLK